MPPLRPPMVKQYVDVIAKWHDDGRIDPLMVCWPDGRTFHVRDVGPGKAGVASVAELDSQTSVYKVRIGAKPVTLYLERHGSNPSSFARWYVLYPEGRKPWKFGFDAGAGSRLG